MDCCGSSKPKETEKDIKSDQTGNEKPAQENTGTEGENHCGDKNSDMSSMMGSSSNADVKGMM